MSTKLKKSNCDQTQNPNFDNSKTKILTKLEPWELKNYNSHKTQFPKKLDFFFGKKNSTTWQPMRSSLSSVLQSRGVFKDFHRIDPLGQFGLVVMVGHLWWLFYVCFSLESLILKKKKKWFLSFLLFPNSFNWLNC